jgi:hypothetical protein
MGIASPHPTSHNLNLYLRNDLSPSEQIEISNHILWCRDCRAAVNEYRSLVAFFQGLKNQREAQQIA